MLQQQQNTGIRILFEKNLKGYTRYQLKATPNDQKTHDTSHLPHCEINKQICIWNSINARSFN
jgi:hypothetical protein